MIAILSHPIPENEMRSEIEVEVMFKWVRQQADSDFTGIAHTIKQCKSRKTIITVLQNARMESFNPGEPILFQGTFSSRVVVARFETHIWISSPAQGGICSSFTKGWWVLRIVFCSPLSRTPSHTYPFP